MSCISVTMDATLSTEVANTGDPGSFYKPSIGSARKSADSEIGQQAYTFSSPASFLALAIPSGLTGRFLYLKNTGSEDIDVRITFATQGATVVPLASKGMIMLEPSEDEGISSVEVQGDSKIEWLLTGDLA